MLGDGSGRPRLAHGQRAKAPLSACLQPRPRESMFKRLYHRVLSLAESPHAPAALAAIAFAESSFFPIPPDVILVPMSLPQPQRAWRYAAICTVASVAGGIVGY